MSYDLTLYYFLKQNVPLVYITTSKDETYIRCPFCGDSMKDSRKARFYINNKPPFKFHCFNCDIAGIVNDDVLDFIIDNSSMHGASLNGEILKYLKESRMNYNSNLSRFKKNVSKIPYFNINNKVDFNISSYKGKYLDKLDYLSNRLNYKFTNKKAINRFKIVLSIKEFYKNNGLDIRKRIGNDEKIEYIIDQLEKKYIGFLSSDRHIIIFRNIDKDDNHRFNNFNILSDSEEFDSSKTYNITTNIDLYKDKNKVFISEGPIDIIGAYIGLFNENIRSNSIFMANGGKSYINTFWKLTSMGLYNNDYTILSDNDVKLDFYKRMKLITPILCNSKINIYYNSVSKDFGVSKDNISLSPKYTI